jgi:hypothetical protein
LGAESSQDERFHIKSHAPLLQAADTAVAADGPLPQRRLEAIVVPTIRPQWLAPAIALADETGCALVVLCSTPDQAKQAVHECRALTGELLVTHVSADAEESMPELLTSRHPENDIIPSCHVDIARKRNVGLLLARLCGWRTIMFLDDDIRGLTAGAVSNAVALTARFQAAGFKIHEYPDNSVVCHAYRLAGGGQDVFLGGSALLIDVARAQAFFPAIYNEDWLFLFDAARSGTVAMAGTLSQLEYHPFANPRRAASEEFGDLIGEGLYRLLHEGRAVAYATRPYWRHMIEQRFRLIDHIADRLLSESATPATDCALMSLAAARKRLAGITELACLSFVRAWRTDMETWREALSNLPDLPKLASAAEHLHLTPQDRDTIP